MAHWLDISTPQVVGPCRNTIGFFLIDTTEPKDFKIIHLSRSRYWSDGCWDLVCPTLALTEC